MNCARQHPVGAAIAAALLLAGCGTRAARPAALGRPIESLHSNAATTSAASSAAAPIGDPSPERGGHIAPGAAAAQVQPMAGGLASSPTGALTRFAIVYTNWRATGLLAREHGLAELAVGAARINVEQTAASRSGAEALAADHVANRGWVIAVAPGEGPDRGQWVIVTEEQTTGTGPYAGLPPGPHVTLAAVRRLVGGWAVSNWDPVS